MHSCIARTKSAVCRLPAAVAITWLAAEDEPLRRTDRPGRTGRTRHFIADRCVDGKDDPVINEILRLGVTPSMPDRKILGVDLTPQQYSEYVALAGKPMKQALDRIVALSKWPRISDVAKAELIQRP
jgi:hypothetical protein